MARIAPALQVALASILAALGIAFGSLWFLTVLGLALFFHALWFRTATWARALLYGFLFGFVTSGVSIYWFWDTLPLTWLGIGSPVAQLVAVGGNWLIDTSALALAVTAGAGILWYLRTSPLLPYLAALTWMLAEEGRMWAFALVNWAPQSLMGPHFSIASLGYALANEHYLLQLAYPFGVLALNFSIALIAALIALLPSRRANRARFIVALLGVGILLCLSLLVHAPVPARSAPLRIALLHTDIPAGVTVRSQSVVFEDLLERTAKDTSVSIIVFPEGETPEFLSGNEADKQAAFRRLFGNRDVLLIYSEYERSPDDIAQNRPGGYLLTYESTVHGILGTYRKELLMPFGEYVPTYLSFFYRLINIEGTEYVAKLSEGTRRGDRTQAVLFGGATVGALLCSDLHSPLLYHELADQGATLFVNLSNQSWFNGSPLLVRKTLEIAKVHAVEAQVPLVAANNSAPAFAIAPDGRLIATSPFAGIDAIIVDVLPAVSRTP